MGAKVQGTFTTGEVNPPLLNSGLTRTQQNYYTLRSNETGPKPAPITKNPVIIDKNTHVHVTFNNMRSAVISIPGVITSDKARLMF